MAFNIPNQTSYIKQRPVNPYSAWTRQADWITITDTPDEVQFLTSNLVGSAYTITTTFTQTGGVGNIYIDWGDGTIDTVSTIAQTETSHTYTTSGTPCSLGYDTYKVRVYGDAGTRITLCRVGTIAVLLIPFGVLEAYYGDNTILTATNLFYGINFGRYTLLEYVKLPSVMSGDVSTFDNAFRECPSLAKVVMPTSCSDAYNIRYTFANCYSLQEIVLPQDATNLGNYEACFFGCSSLTGVTFPPSSNNVFSMPNAFNGCRNLTSIKLPPLPICTNYNQTFLNCNNLITLEFQSFTSGATSINLASMAQGCSSLEYVKMPTTVAAGTIFNGASMFSTCPNLKSFIFPTNFDASSLASAFLTCGSLSSCIMPTSMPSLTTMAACFNGCNLQEITLPTTVGATISLGTCFSNNYSLSEITIPSSYNLTALNGAFSNCYSLNKIVLPNNSQNSLTLMNTMCSGCFNLKSIVMPTSMTAMTALAGSFTNCYNLESVVFPSTMNSVTSINNMFQNCYSLQSVTLPTSMTSLTLASLVFDACASINSVVLPATTGNITTYAQAFRNCYSIQSVTLPTSPQSTALTTVNGMFTNTYKLNTINNVDKLGNPSTSSTIYVDGTGFSINNQDLTTLDFYTKFSKLELYGNSLASILYSKLASLRLRNNGTGQYAGTSPQINISYTDLSQAALVQVFNDLPTVTSKTINITGATGAAALTAPERAIATSKGWTITG